MKHDIIEPARQRFKNLGLTETEVAPDLRIIKVEGGQITIDLFSSEKIEKMMFSSIELYETGVVESTVMAWPNDDYCFPALWCNLTIVPEVMNIPICDFIPLMDMVVWPEYRETYITELAETRLSALEILGDTVVDKAVDVPSASVCAFSPYKLVARISDNGVALVPRMMEEYFDSYLAMVERDRPVAVMADREFYLKKKHATRELMRQNDPGYPFMIDVFGEEITEKVFNIIF
ncbi:MAG: hypothetical protein GY762_18530 [Proteobacteria bacterium]|nr:hypothetical protein [Pseudomonadota bacterium]